MTLIDARGLGLVELSVTTIVMRGPYVSAVVPGQQPGVAWAEVLPLGPREWAMRQELAAQS